MPILIYVGFFSLLTTYVFDKVALLRVCATPPQYSAMMAFRFSSFIPLAVFMHCIMGGFFFGSTVWGPLTTSNALSAYTSVGSTFLTTLNGQGGVQTAASLLLQSRALPLTLLAAGLAALFLFSFIRKLVPITINIQFDFLDHDHFQRKLPRLSLSTLQPGWWWMGPRPAFKCVVYVCALFSRGVGRALHCLVSHVQPARVR